MTRFGSLFSGIGGLDMAVKACGWEPAWQIEQDEFCTRVLERYWPDVRRYGDIREVDWRSVEPVELVCGGFPCQPFSVAGQNRGEDDERNMWPETYRAVRELGPRYVFLENVPGLLAHEYFGRILGDLAQGGYDAVWDTFTAAEVGAPHRRERLFILAYAGREHKHVQQPPRRLREPAGEGVRVADADTGRHGRQAEAVCAGRDADFSAAGDVGHPEGEQRQGRPEPTGRAGQALPGRSGATVANAGQERRESPGGIRKLGRDGPSLESKRMADATSRRDSAESRSMERSQATESSPGYQPSEEPWRRSGFPPGPDDRAAWARVLAEVPALEPAVCRVATGIPDRTHRLRALGNAVVPAQGEYAFRTLWERMME